jgi:hypothetical protein
MTADTLCLVGVGSSILIYAAVGVRIMWRFGRTDAALERMETQLAGRAESN